VSVTRYREKGNPGPSLEVEAMRWEPSDLLKAGLLVGWLMACGVDFYHPSGIGDTTTLAIKTPDGEVIADPGDWIVKGARAAFSTCKPDDFAATYERYADG